jgi:DNA mismatch repair protein MutL
LLEQRDLAQDTHHCPHGPPTAVGFSRQDVDRLFQQV